MKIVFLFIVIPAVLFGGNFSDDFESHTEGNDISAPGSWINTAGGSFVVAVDGSNKVAETDWDGNKNIVYLSPGPFTDGTVTADVKFSGFAAGLGLVTRGDYVDGTYFGAIICFAPRMYSTVIAHRDGRTGKQFVLAQNPLILNEDTWYTLSFKVTGTNPVQLSVAVNGKVNSLFNDTVYLLDYGFTGVAAGFESAEPVLCFDNYMVNDYSTSLARTTFGGIKASFR